MSTRVREDYPGAGSVQMVALRNLPDWRVAEGDPDIRGWDTVDQSETKVGQIDDLIIDTRSGEAAFALVSYGGSLGIGTKHTLIPIDDLQIDRDQSRVLVDYPAESLKSAPEYEEGKADYGSFRGFWSGMAAGHVRGEQRQPQERQTILQRLVNPQGQAQAEHGTGQTTGTGVGRQVPQQAMRRVRLHIGRRSSSGEESTVKDGDVLTIPVAGQADVLDEIFIRLEAVEEEEEHESPRFRV